MTSEEITPETLIPAKPPSLVPAVVVCVLVLTFSIGLIWASTQMRLQSIEDSALDEARQYSNAMSILRSIYTSEVVARFHGSDVKVTHDYEQDAHAITLPAISTMLVGKRMRKL